MPTAPEYLFNTLLAASSSRIGTAARVIINPEGGYKQPCILWTANASTADRQNPPQQEIIDPLEAMEAASELYDAQVEDYEQDGDKNARHLSASAAFSKRHPRPRFALMETTRVGCWNILMNW